MKILQVYHIYPAIFGGVSRVVYDISRELCKKGHEISVLTTDFHYAHINAIKTENSREVEVYRIPTILKNFRTINIPLPHPYFIHLVKSKIKSFDVIHFHGHRSLQKVAVYYYAEKNGVPYVLQAHGSLPRIGSWKKLKWFYDVLFGYRLLKDASKVIALSEVEAGQYRSMGVPEEKIAIIPNGIDLSEYAELPPKGAFKKKFGIPEDKKIILYLGRIHKIKGIDFLVRAYAHLKNEMHFKDAVLVIAGPDDGYLGEVKSLVQGLDVSNSVLFTGPLYGRDKISAYVDSEVYVLPSRYEAFPMSVLEAYACGKPVIASKVGGVMDLVIEGVTGLLFEPGDVTQLAKSIFLLLDNHEKAEDMGMKGKQFVKENFSIEKVVEKLEKVYEEVVEG